MRKMMMLVLMAVALITIFSVSAMAQYPGNDNPCNIDFYSEACQIQCYYQPSMCVPISPTQSNWFWTVAQGVILWLPYDPVELTIEQLTYEIAFIDAQLAVVGGGCAAGAAVVVGGVLTYSMSCIVYEAVDNAIIESEMTDYCNQYDCSASGG
jgi:hypothetical protein